MIGGLRERGTAVIYISHKLEEVFRLADRVTVLRDGWHVSTQPINELTPNQLIALMVGRELPQAFSTAVAAKGDAALSVRGLHKTGRFRDVSFEVRGGEILGLAGLMGAGRTDLVNAIYGLDPAEAGEIRVKGRAVRIRKPADALAAGIGLVSEDRKVFGLVPTLGVKPNMTLSALKRWCRAGLIHHAAETRAADEQVRAFAIKTSGPGQRVEHLSGGNQQKVVLARTLLTEPQVLLLDEPTRGIDIAAKAEVHALIARLAALGKAVVLVSSELPELFSLSSRILVMRQGEATAQFDTRATTPEEVLKFAMPK
jgi:ABC-type sugar transport system ATPase subunit